MSEIMQNTTKLDQLSRIMARGVKYVPDIQVATIENLNKNDVKFGHQKAATVKELLGSYSAVLSRFNSTRIDLSFELMASHHGEVKENLKIGRLWSAYYDADWQYSDGGLYPTVKLDLAPAFAGFRHGMQDIAATRALTAMSAVLKSGPNDIIPDETRAAINSLITSPTQPARMLLRMAVLWVASAIAETADMQLWNHTNNDDNEAIIINSMGQFGIALKAVTKQGVQPLLVNIRGTAEGERYMRIARVLCLNKPAFAMDDSNAPPTITKLWPAIHRARAYQLSQVDQLATLAGPISSRDIAIFSSYYARCLNMVDQLEDFLNLACGMAYRPAGSALAGQHSTLILELPPSQLGATILLPVIQATDTLDSEGILHDMDEPHNRLLYGAMHAGVFLASLNNVTKASLGDVVGRFRNGLDKRIRAHQSRFLARSVSGSPAVCSAVALASKVGWGLTFSDAWLTISTSCGLSNGQAFPVEYEELIPWVTAFPNTSAALGIFRPVHLVTTPATGAYCRVTGVNGRIGTSDAIYSMIAMKIRPKVFQALYDGGWPANPKSYEIRASYRNAPQDGQFEAHRLDTVHWQPLFQIPTAAGVLVAMHGHQRRKTWLWTYEWFIPYGDIDVNMQYIEHAMPIPQTDIVPTSSSEQPLITVQPGPKVKYPSGTVDEPNTLRDVLGDVWGQLLDARNAMAAVVGKQVTNPRYDSLARTYAGTVTGLSLDMLPFIMPEDKLPTLWTWLYNYACEAAAWVSAPGMQQDCNNVANYALAQLQIPMNSAPPPTLETTPIVEPDTQIHDSTTQSALPLLTKNSEAQQSAAIVSGVAEGSTPLTGSTGLLGMQQHTTSELATTLDPGPGTTTLGFETQVQDVQFQD
jgi:hypothetical protein